MNQLVYPRNIMIETVSGICNYRCIMCPVEASPTNEIMPNERFKRVLERFVPYLEHQQLLSFCGLGEMTLDKGLPEKVEIAKKLGFKGTGVYTNGETLGKMAKRLLSSELDTVIISIDGITQEVQGKIRVRSNLSKVIESTKHFFDCRNQMDAKTKIIIRFNRQDINRHEEKDFRDFWAPNLISEKGDVILTYDIHNVGGNVSSDLVTIHKQVEHPPGPFTCPELWGKMMIGSNGDLIFCCGDQTNERKNILGNVLETDPMELYNHAVYQHFRTEMTEGRINGLDICRGCSVPTSIATREDVTAK